MATEDLSVRRTADDPSTREERRARREARRAKQRNENVGRAARMHAARVVWEREATTLPVQNTGFDLPQINVGCSGWFYWHWRGRFYGADMPTSNWFVHYTHHFRTVELNAPFYSWPTPATVCGWRRQAGRRKFVYSVKVSELITHVHSQPIFTFKAIPALESSTYPRVARSRSRQGARNLARSVHKWRRGIPRPPPFPLQRHGN
jgi:Protein of unknown function DUF72